jgi:1,4-dihydroxy-2-naphthoyl-CoA hydrolase
MEQSAERAVCRMPFTDSVRSATGVVHAGALIWLADLTATFLAREGSDVTEDGRGFPLLIDLHASVLANQQGGYVTAVARPVRRGRRVTVVRTSVRGEDGKLLCEVTTTHIPW